MHRESFNAFNAVMAFDLVLPAFSLEWECGYIDGNYRCHVQTQKVLENLEYEFPEWTDP